MDKLSNLALLGQMLESAEKNIQSARQIMREIMGSAPARGAMAERAKVLTVSSTGKIVEGVFDGQNMLGPDGKKYPVPANYASKSKLVEGDILKLTIADDGSFIYKQIGPVERLKKIGILTQAEGGDYRVLADGKAFKVLLASLTYFKAEPGDEVTVVVPKGQDSEWAALENIIKKSGDEHPVAPEAPPAEKSDIDSDLELGEE